MDGKSGCVWPFVAVCGSVSLAMDGTHDCMPKHVSLTDPTVEISLNRKISKNRLK